VDKLNWFLLKISDDRKSILRFVNCPFKEGNFWRENKRRLIDEYIKKTEHLVPNLSGHIVYKDAASPGTLSRWTSNYQGASYGWAGLPAQIAVQGFSGKTSVRNLYLTGHWATLFQGVPGVAFLGRNRAKTILNNWRQA
jgi:phytoene dehydrogenase-like protein